MSENSPPPSPNDFDARLKAARARRAGRGGSERLSRGGGLAMALRIGVELVAALIVGVGIGVLLDRWLGTAPWLMVLFFVLGAAAGMMNVFRVVAGYDSAVGFRRPKRDENRPDSDRRDDD